MKNKTILLFTYIDKQASNHMPYKCWCDKPVVSRWDHHLDLNKAIFYVKREILWYYIGDLKKIPNEIKFQPIQASIFEYKKAFNI